MILYIKHMVSLRCKMILQTILEKLNIDFLAIELGTVKLARELSSQSHLCHPFKKITGQTPSQFKKLFDSGEMAWAKKRE